MNLTDPGFRAYWLESLVAQVEAGQYDGIFFDSASPPLIQGETVDEPRLKGTGVKDTIIPELGGVTYITAWEAWIAPLNAALKEKGIPLIPNYDNFGTSWDTTNYSLTEGTCSEGFASAGLDVADWERSTNQILRLASQGKILVLQDYLKSAPLANHRTAAVLPLEAIACWAKETRPRRRRHLLREKHARMVFFSS